MQTPRQRSMSIMKELADKHQQPMRVITGAARDKAAVTARREIIISLFNDGVQPAKIAEYLNRDHSSVLQVIRRDMKNKRVSK